MIDEDVPGKKELEGVKKRDLVELIRHAWVHSAYSDCGFMQMTTPQKRLYCRIVGGTVDERHEAHARSKPCTCNQPARP